MSEAEPMQMSKMKGFAVIVNDQKAVLLTKLFILDVWRSWVLLWTYSTDSKNVYLEPSPISTMELFYKNS